MRPPDTRFRSRPALPLTAAAGLILLLCACGQSGGLYLPDKKTPEPVSTAPEATSMSEEEKKKESEEAQQPAPPPPSTTSPSTTPPPSP